MAEGYDKSLGSDEEKIQTDDNSTQMTDLAGVSCEPCKQEGSIVEIEGYCVECKEYLCSECFRTHRKPRPSRNHTLQNVSDMRKECGIREQTSTGSQVKCSIHDEKISMFCENHDQMCCVDCVSTAHFSCQDVKDISSEAKNILESKEFMQYEEKLKYLQDQYNNIKKKTEISIEEISECCEYTQMKVNRAIKSMADREINSVKQNVTACKDAMDSLSRTLISVDSMKQKEENEMLFIKMKMSGVQLKAAEDAAITIGRSSVTKFGFVEAQSSILCGSFKEMPEKIGSFKPLHVLTGTANYRGLLILNENVLIASEMNSKKVVIINTETTKTVEKQFSDFPYGMAKTKCNKVYVAIADGKKLTLLRSPLTDISDTEDIPIGMNCCNVSVTESSLVIQCYPPATTIITDMNGKNLRVLCDSFPGSLKTPFTFKINSTTYNAVMQNTSEALFVSDVSNNVVFEVKMDGNVTLIDVNIKRPRGMVFGSDGALFVCSEESQNVVKVKNGVILDAVKGIDFSPFIVALNDENDKMYVAGNGNEIYIYQIK
ncbi:protein wech-like [Mya arenaria]|uniref:protein wech-like n=1 Tax=Mya arenaria TaxID=6604 RepID=UPI0022E89949|nr:protein wech-like [Mya arenaria]